MMNMKKRQKPKMKVDSSKPIFCTMFKYHISELHQDKFDPSIGN